MCTVHAKMVITFEMIVDAQACNERRIISSYTYSYNLSDNNLKLNRSCYKYESLG